jgi:hypothetical protein
MTLRWLSQASHIFPVPAVLLEIHYFTPWKLRFHINDIVLWPTGVSRGTEIRSQETNQCLPRYWNTFSGDPPMSRGTEIRSQETHRCLSRYWNPFSGDPPVSLAVLKSVLRRPTSVSRGTEIRSQETHRCLSRYWNPFSGDQPVTFMEANVKRKKQSVHVLEYTLHSCLH